MKENMLDVLMYLFENYMNDEIEFSTDEDALRSELLDAGFHKAEISKAFDWLEGLGAPAKRHHTTGAAQYLLAAHLHRQGTGKA